MWVVLLPILLTHGKVFEEIFMRIFDSSRLSIARLLPPHTFSAYCSDLSKSEGQLCYCHETGLKPVLFMIGLPYHKRSPLARVFSEQTSNWIF